MCWVLVDFACVWGGGLLLGVWGGVFAWVCRGCLGVFVGVCGPVFVI